MFGKVLGGIAIGLGALLCAIGWIGYQMNMSSAVGASAIQISQLANQATVDLLGGIGLILFGAATEVTAYLGEIRDNQKKTAPQPAST
jgi:hypothetical protein